MKHDDFKIRKLPNERHQLEYINPVSNKRVRKQFHSLDDAILHKNQLIHEARYGELANGQRFVGHFMQVYLTKYPDSRVTERRANFLSFCEAFNHWEISKVTTKALRDWFHLLKDKGGYTDKNLNSIKSIMNHFFKYLMDEEIISINPLEPICFSRRGDPKRPKIILTGDELKEALALLKDFSPDLLYPFVYVVTSTGCRRDEARKLKWKHIDFNTELITLIGTKNGKNRMIRMSPNLKSFLQALPKESQDDFVFLNTRGKMRTADQIDYQLARFQKAYPDQKKWRSHDLRHTFAHNFLKAGGMMYELKAILGHSNISMTIDYYGHFTASDVKNSSPYDF